MPLPVPPFSKNASTSCQGIDPFWTNTHTRILSICSVCVCVCVPHKPHDTVDVRGSSWNAFSAQRSLPPGVPFPPSLGVCVPPKLPVHSSILPGKNNHGTLVVAGKKTALTS